MFSLHEKLRMDTIMIGRMELSILLLMNDCSLPWLILVPEREGVSEIDELSTHDRSLLIEEIAAVSAMIRKLYNPDKVNVGALGNLVPQLHLHVIGRFRNDRAWPGPIWGINPVDLYEEEVGNAESERIRAALQRRMR
jgi:diadenosine tetraphosphate (Ap4A) HIT family hydrolase